MVLPLSALVFDASNGRGNYSIFISGSPAFNLHSVGYGATDALPVAGLADAYASLVSYDSGSSWATQLPFRGAALTAIQQTCAPSASQSATYSPSQSASSSASSSGSPSFSPSQALTPSVSGTATETTSPSPTLSVSQLATSSQSPSQTVTPSQVYASTRSQSRTQTPTQVVTLSMSRTRSQSATMSATSSSARTPSQSASQTTTMTLTSSQSVTPTATGFPKQVFLDNTDSLNNALYMTAQVVSPTDVSAFSLYLPEADPQCGPGRYLLKDISSRPFAGFCPARDCVH